MPKEHGASVEFAQALDVACGRMIAQGLKRDAMVCLADELACMLSNESYEPTPEIPYSRELYRLMVSLKRYLGSEMPSDHQAAELDVCLRGLATKSPALSP